MNWGGVLETSTSSSPGSPSGLADIQNGRHGTTRCLPRQGFEAGLARLGWAPFIQ